MNRHAWAASLVVRRAAAALAAVWGLFLMGTSAQAEGMAAPRTGWGMAKVHPALHLAGDSTMADKPLDPPQPERGWGMLLREQLQQPERIVNHAANGRSTRNFQVEGRWAHLLSQLAPGDCVLIQFGHNDQKRDDPRRWADPQTDYPDNLRRFVHDVRSRHAVPLIATSVSRRRFDAQGRIVDTLAPYPDVARQVAREPDVTLIDLNAATARWLEGLGPERSKAMFMWIEPGQYAGLPNGRRDNTHFVEDGASAVAAMALKLLYEQRPELRDWLR
jgi:lysophospholipase L1-like esterase